MNILVTEKCSWKIWKEWHTFHIFSHEVDVQQTEALRVINFNWKLVRLENLHLKWIWGNKIILRIRCWLNHKLWIAGYETIDQTYPHGLKFLGEWLWFTWQRWIDFRIFMSWQYFTISPYTFDMSKTPIFIGTRSMHCGMMSMWKFPWNGK